MFLLPSVTYESPSSRVSFLSDVVVDHNQWNLRVVASCTLPCFALMRLRLLLSLMFLPTPTVERSDVQCQRQNDKP
jgi:hypothetical protein